MTQDHDAPVIDLEQARKDRCRLEVPDTAELEVIETGGVLTGTAILTKDEANLYREERDADLTGATTDKVLLGALEALGRLRAQSLDRLAGDARKAEPAGLITEARDRIREELARYTEPPILDPTGVAGLAQAFTILGGDLELGPNPAVANLRAAKDELEQELAGLKAHAANVVAAAQELARTGALEGRYEALGLALEGLVTEAAR